MRPVERAIATVIVFLLLTNVGVLIGLAEQEHAKATSAHHPSAPPFVSLDQPYDYRGERHALESLRQTRIHERNLERLRAAQRREREAAQNSEQRAEPEQQARSGTVGLGRTASVVAACESGKRRASGTAIVGTLDWTARNPNSTAAGAFQFLRGTWRRVAPHVGAGGYPTAAHAPPRLQRAAFRWLHARRGLRPWLASASCWRPMLR